MFVFDWYCLSFSNGVVTTGTEAPQELALIFDMKTAADMEPEMRRTGARFSRRTFAKEYRAELSDMSADMPYLWREV